MKQNKWRLIPLLKASGEMQMAIDKWLCLQHKKRKQPPTLRFYTWFPAAISLGYHQKKFPNEWNNLIWKGQKVDLVHRPTGGRAVLHQGDLTYMIVTSGLTGSRLEVYKKICQFLIKGWHNLGMELHYGEAGRGYINNPNCFATSTGADLVNQKGEKLIGSAQLKQGNVILQHGSMNLNPDLDLYNEVFGEILPIKSKFPPYKTIIQQLVIAASHCFNCEFERKALTNEEVREIYQQKNKDK